MAAIIVLESLKSTTTKPNAPQASSTPSGPFDNLGVIIGIVTGCMIAIMILVPIIAGLCDITENHRKDRKARKLTANNNDGGESGRGGIELRRRDVEIQGRDEDRVEEQGEDDVTEEDIDFTEEDIEVIEGRYAELPAYDGVRLPGYDEVWH